MAKKPHIQYPRACPKCHAVIRDKGNYSGHIRRCRTSEHRVACPCCDKMFSRKDACKRHIKNIHSKGAKRKAEDG